MKAVILSAGEGQRLRPFTVMKPKVMLKVANKPILEYVVDALRDSGIRDITMVVGYKKESIMDYFGDGRNFGVRIEYIFQKQQLGTAHALKQAEDNLRGDFLVLPGDNIIDADTVKRVLSTGKYAIAYKVIQNPAKYGMLIAEKGVLKRIVENSGDAGSNLVNTGIYYLDESIFDFIGNEVNLPEVINSMIESGYDFKVVEGNIWLDAVYPWDLLRLNELAMNFRGRNLSGKVERNAVILGDVMIGEGTHIRAGAYIKGPAIISKNCEIGANSFIAPSTSIGENSRIEEFCRIENSIIGDNVVIGAGSYIKDSVIDSGTVIEPRTTVISERAEMRVEGEIHEIKGGAFIGEGCSIGAGCIIRGGTIIGNFSQISPLKLIQGRIPDNSKVL
ncbi:MAG: NTP transferase domain-containing protein [Archaeoglobi archaeon]|nr:NTP transferase domain-containing protein [Candidatus Mnemosynella sp.]